MTNVTDEVELDERNSESNQLIKGQEVTDLIHRITKRISSWSCRLLSRAGRCCLVKAVLQAMTAYWARVFILPKKLIDTVNMICARFLWNGTGVKKGGHLVNWNVVCMEKREGGLGIKNLAVMKNAIVLKQVWDVKENEGNLWSKWVKAYWICNANWWELNDLKSGSWVLNRLKHCMQRSSNCILVRDDGAIWCGNGSEFSVSNAYQSMRLRGAEVEWGSLVWGKYNSPRDSFTCWLAAHNKLSTKDRLSNRGMQIQEVCVLCKHEVESRDHLFFECVVSKTILKNVMIFLNLVSVPCQWHMLIPWFNVFKKGALKTMMVAAGITMVISEVWYCRNRVIFKNDVVNIETIQRKIVHELKLKIGDVYTNGLKDDDRRWLARNGFTV